MTALLVALAAALSPAHPADQVSLATSYRKRGGVGGISQSMVIHRDGSARALVNGKRVRFRLTASERSALRAALAGYASYPESSHPLPGATDAFEWTLVHGGRTVSVTTPDAGSIPGGLGKLVRTLDGIVDKHG
jgi:hypothetical protein